MSLHRPPSRRHLRGPVLLAASAALLTAAATAPIAPATAQAARPAVLKVTPRAGGPQATFTVRVPGRLFGEVGPASDSELGRIQIRRPFTFCDAEGGCGGSEQTVAITTFTVRPS